MNQYLQIRISGAVQGVGFRPFIYHLANELSLQGTVKNTGSGVHIRVEGERNSLEEFVIRIRKDKPVNAHISNIELDYSQTGFQFSKSYGFRIIESSADEEISAMILPDLAVCDDCLHELFDINNKRYLYPFINCINCGPRFSIIEALPYDRCNTSMKNFVMCDECKKEYEDPLNRRFHAQPIACPQCGPHISLWDSKGNVTCNKQDAVTECVTLIRNGKIIALKGIGGFQLLADARNDKTIEELRRRKCRDEKPFAIMFPDINSIKKVCCLSESEEKLLTSVQSPIVLLMRKPGANSYLSKLIAPHNPSLGVMLPYTPLHYIIMKETGFPIIATSGNISEEPMCIDEKDALSRLDNIADYFLVNNRPIVRYVDDSIVRVFSDELIILRRARGYAPLPIIIHKNGSETSTVLAVGGHLKNTISLKKGNNIYISQHIGDLSNEEALKGFKEIIRDFKNLYNVQFDNVISDIHPDYFSTRSAEEISSSVRHVQHHIAHIASCRLENQVKESALGVAWDGTGYGLDGNIWGSEFFLCDDNSFEHFAQFRSFPLPGGESAVRDARRSALGLLFEIFGKCTLKRKGFNFSEHFTKDELDVFEHMLNKKINCPLTSAAGRLFDAVAAITGVSMRSTYEGQSAMMLEFAADHTITETYNFRIRKDGIYIIDWQPMIESIIKDIGEGTSAALISGKFHNTLSKIILVMTQISSQKQVVLSGGCFQNMFLLERTVKKLSENNFTVYFHHEVPTNDGGLSLGQAAMV